MSSARPDCWNQWDEQLCNLARAGLPHKYRGASQLSVDAATNSCMLHRAHLVQEFRCRAQAGECSNDGWSPMHCCRRQMIRTRIRGSQAAGLEVLRRSLLRECCLWTHQQLSMATLLSIHEYTTPQLLPSQRINWNSRNRCPPSTVCEQQQQQQVYVDPKALTVA